MHNGYRPLNPRAPLCELHPSCSKLKVDEDGLLPEWIVYHEIIQTSRPFLTKVCPVSGHLVEGVLEKLRSVDVHRLSGGRFGRDVPSPPAAATSQDASESGSAAAAQHKRRHDEASLHAARERFLKRKAKRTSSH